MSWFFVPPTAIDGGQVRLDRQDSHHWLRVLRARPGESFTAVCAGTAYRAEFTGTDQGQVLGRIIAETPLEVEPPVSVTVFQGLAKGDKMEWVIQKGTELGATSFVPVETARSVVQLTAAKAAERQERWQRIAREAAQQNRRGAVPVVQPVASWKAAAARAREFDLALVLWEELAGAGADPKVGLGAGGAPQLRPGLKALLRQRQGLQAVALYVGPEGGLEAAEARQAGAAGAHLIRLGPRILRTETAALAAVTALLYEIGDLGE